MKALTLVGLFLALASLGARAPVSGAASPREVERTWIVGHVLDEAEEVAIPRAEVRVTLVRGDVTETLAKVTADRQGAYRVDLSALMERSPSLVLGAELVLRARADGYELSYDDIDGCELQPGRNVLDLELRPGPVLTGRILGPGGIPVAGAWLKGEAYTRIHGARAHTSLGFGCTDADGKFYLSLAHTQPTYLEAGASRFGRVARSLAGLDPSTSADLGDLTLSPEGVIEGRVTCGAGQPVPLVEVSVSSEERGATAGRAWSDARGRFRIAGLTGRSYVVRTSSPRGARFGPCPVGTVDAELRLAGRLLLVEVVDEGGVPLPGASVDCVFLRPEPVLGLDDSDWTWEETRGERAGALLELGDFPLAVLSSEVPGTDHCVRERVELEPKDGLRRHRLVVRRDLPTGRLAVALRDEHGLRIYSYSVVLEPLPDLGSYYFDATDADARGALPPVVARRYQVEVQPGDEHGTDHFLLGFEQALAIRPGEVHRIERTVTLGGRVRITVFCSPAPSRAGWRIEVSCDPPGTGRGHTVYFRPAEPASTYSTDDIAHDRPYVSDVLPPGTYPFRVQHPDYEPVELLVTLRPGRVTEVATRLFLKVR